MNKTEKGVGLFDTVKLKIQEFTSTFSWNKAIEYGIWLASGLCVGFLMKRFGKQLIISFAFTFIVLAIMHYWQLITIDWQVLQKIGIFPGLTLEEAFKAYMRLLRTYVFQIAVGAIGFVIGYKIS